MMTITKACQTYQATIYVAGDVDTIRNVCRHYCERGLCVTVTPTEYIYTGGSETGAAVGMINYPRFSKEPTEIRSQAKQLAGLILQMCSQRSCTIVLPDETLYVENSVFENIQR